MPVMDSLTALERDPEFYIILSELEKASAVFVKTRKRLLRCAPIARAVKDWERRMEQENAMAGRQWEGEWEDEDGGAAASWEDVGDYLNAEKSGLRDHEDPKTEWRKGRKERKRRTAERSKAPYGKASGTSESERLLANEYGYR